MGKNDTKEDLTAYALVSLIERNIQLENRCNDLESRNRELELIVYDFSGVHPDLPSED